MADYAAKDMKLKRVITITDDFAFGYEQIGGFQQTFENNGGKIVKKSSGRRSLRRTIRRSSRRSPIATAYARALPGRTRCAS